MSPIARKRRVRLTGSLSRVCGHAWISTSQPLPEHTEGQAWTYTLDSSKATLPDPTSFFSSWNWEDPNPQDQTFQNWINLPRLNDLKSAVHMALQCRLAQLSSCDWTVFTTLPQRRHQRHGAQNNKSRPKLSLTHTLSFFLSSSLSISLSLSPLTR